MRPRGKSLALLILAAAAGSAAGVAAHEPEPGAALAPGYGPLQFEAAEAGSYSLPGLGEAASGIVLDDSGRARQLYDQYDDRIVLFSFVNSS